ncbi:hypothetical protein BJ508DRAFT_313357 [Ascobolus immersus RN42]|uniref:C2H2-type domain-containing protein n=1 Tax=Ascobolus immersus RN42 TaxID=1160509 RepID=A0A3N4HN31_ASCIM|nr:hypothetical protein BJ508DRAFT_313357 [Ascobolus immersus RN42]
MMDNTTVETRCKRCWKTFASAGQLLHHKYTSHEADILVSFGGPIISLQRGSDYKFGCPVRNCTFTTTDAREIELHCEGGGFPKRISPHKDKVSRFEDLRELDSHYGMYVYKPGTQAVTKSLDTISNIVMTRSKTKASSNKVSKSTALTPQARPVLPRIDPEDTPEMKKLKSSVKDAILKITMDVLDPKTDLSGKIAAAKIEEIFKAQNAAARMLRAVDSREFGRAEEDSPATPTVKTARAGSRGRLVARNVAQFKAEAQEGSPIQWG